MRKAAQIVFIVNLCVAILVAVYLCYTLATMTPQLITGGTSASSSARTSGGSSSEMGYAGLLFIPLFLAIGLGYLMIKILLTMLLIGVCASMVFMTIGLCMSFTAKSKSSVIAIGILNCIFGSVLAGIFLLVSKPREYELPQRQNQEGSAEEIK